MDSVNAIAIDGSGRAYLAGKTDAMSGFQVTSNAYQSTGGGGPDAFLVVLDPSQSGSAGLIYGTYLGGTAPDEAYGITYFNGSAYIVGQTGSNSGIATSGAYQTAYGGGNDGFLARFDFNTSPTLSGANNLTAINENPATNPGTLVSALIAGQVTDPDLGALSGIAVIAVDDTNGTWQYSLNGGSSWLSFGAPSQASARLLAADANTLVRFVPNLNWSGTDAGGLVFRAWDQTSGTAGGTASVTVNGGGTAFSAANGNGTAATSITVNYVNQPPTVATPAAAAPGSVTGTSTTLSVLGADDGGEANLTYTWTVTAEPAGAANPTYSANGTNGAKNTTATFSQAGSYTFLVTIADTGGLTTTSSVAVTVLQTLTTITDSPPAASLNLNGTQSFSAIGYDQFSVALAVQPSFTWATASGVGSINASGLYTAGNVAGSATITAASGSVVGSAAVTVTNAAPTVATPAAAAPGPVTGTSTALSVLGADDGGAANLTYTWTVTAEPAGAANPTYSANGTNGAKNTTAIFSQGGSYTFLVSIADTGGLTTTSSVAVTVLQTLTTITDSPPSASLNLNGTQSFSAIGYDQFGAALAVQPSFTWALASGVGSINAFGLYTAGSVAGSATITATSGSVAGSGAVTVTNAAPTVATGGGGPWLCHWYLHGPERARCRRWRRGEPDLHLDGHRRAAGRGQPDLQRQWNQRGQEHHRHVFPGRQLHLRGDDRRHRRFDDDEQCRRDRPSDPDHDHRFTVVGESEPQWHPVILRGGV